MSNGVPVAILCGGMATRLQSVQPDVAKALTPVCGKPYLSRLIQFAYGNGCGEIHLLTGHQHEQIEDFVRSFPVKGDMRIQLHREPYPLGTGGAVKSCFQSVASDLLLVINGDTLFDLPLLSFIRDSQEMIDNGKGLVALSLAKASNARYGMVELHGQYVRRLYAPGSAPSGLCKVEAGYTMVHRSAFEKTLIPPFSMFGGLYPILAEEGALVAFSYDAVFLDFGIPEDYGKVDEAYRSSSWSRAQYA